MGLFNTLKKALNTIESATKEKPKKREIPNIQHIIFNTKFVKIKDISDIKDLKESICHYMEYNEIYEFKDDDFQKWILEEYQLFEFEIDTIWEMIDNSNFKNHDKYKILKGHGEDLEIVFAHGIEEADEPLVKKLKKINMLDNLDKLKEDLEATYINDIKSNINGLPQAMQDDILKLTS